MSRVFIMLAVVLILSLLVHGVMPYHSANFHNCPNADGTQNLYTPHDICICTANAWESYDYPICYTLKYFSIGSNTGDYHSPTNYECAQGYYYREKEYWVWGVFGGYYMACIPCASGQIRHYDMNNVRTCQACNADSRANTDQSSCNCKCKMSNIMDERVVDYYNTNRYTCVPVPPGKVSEGSWCRSYGYVEEYTLLNTCNAGIYCIGGVINTCPRGSYCPFSGMSAPSPCPIATYCPNEGMVSYFGCPAGNYCPGGTSAPTPCPVGSYCPEGSDAAISCTAGSYCPNQGMATPLACPTGYTCPSAGMSVGCPLSYTTGSASSITCSPCYYPNYVSGTSCSSSNAVPSTYYIPACSPGYGLISSTYWAKGYKNCQNPNDNNNKKLWYENWWDTTYASSLQRSFGVINNNWVMISSPTYCDTTVSPTPTMTTQSSWSVSKAGVNNLNPICQQCPRGTYQSNLGTYATEPYVFVCLNCPSGYTSPPGSTSSGQCTSCTYGAFPSPYPNNGAYCYCAGGSYNTLTTTACTQCTGGYFSLSSASVCTICAAGKYSAVGSSACIPCAKGTITSTAGRSVCTPCAGNTYASAEGMSTCTACSTGQYAVPGSSVCSNCNKKFNCNTGKYMTSCFCDVGEYMSINPVTYCLTKTVSQDTSFCTTCRTSSTCVTGTSYFTNPCLTGKETSDSQCTACSTGFCPTGYYRNLCNTTTNSLCTLPLTICSNGSYLQGYSVYSNGVCTPCAVCGTGTTISQECSNFAPRICGGVCSNASGCVNSVCAYLSLLGKNSCAICPAGYRVENGLCRACNKNTICNSDGSYVCNGICPLGTIPTCAGCTTCSLTALSVAHAYYDRTVIYSQCTGTFKCDNGYYYDLDSKQCLACFSPGSSYIAVTYGLYFNDPSTCIWDLNLVSNVANSMGYYSSLNLLCPTGTTSEANNANYETDCRSCPSIPYVGLIMTNTWLCEWKCDVGYSQVGASCQNNFVTTGCDTKGHILSGLICTLTPIPWQPAGHEAGSNYIYIVTSNMTQNLTYYPFRTPSMAAVERTSYLTNSTFTFNNKNIISPGMVCSAAMEVDGTVYVVFCNVSAIFYLDSLNKPRRLIGQSTSGYLEGIKNHALFEAELYIALAEKGRIIVLDTWNCVIREVVLGALGVGDFLTTSYFLFGTIANNQPLCIDIIYPKMLFSLAVEGYMAFINKEDKICQIQVSERRMMCSSISINMKNFASISSNSNGTILYVMYTNYTLQYSNQGLGACPDDYTSLAGGACNIYVPWKDGAFGGYYIKDGVAQICIAADCGIGYFPSLCTRSSASICVACSVQSTYGIQYTMPGMCNYRYIAPCPVNTYADENNICQNCPSVMYTSTWNSSGIGSCLCPVGLSKVDATCIVNTSLFPMLDAPLCEMQKYDTTMQSCVQCALADCVSVKVGQYATSCHGNVSSCVIPANSYATSAGTIGIPTSCTWKCDYGYYVDESGVCVQCWNHEQSNYHFYIDDQCNTDYYRWTYTYRNPFICPSDYPFSKGPFWPDTYFCSMCYPCLPGYYMTETCNFLIPAVCTPCTVCKHGYKSPCTSTADAVCHDYGECIANYSLSIPSWLTTHSEIRCKKGEYISNLTDTTPVCTHCPSYLVGLNGMYCEPCIGYKNVYFDNSVCVCKSPTIQNDLDQCVCPVGYYLGIDGCDICGNNTYNDQALIMPDQWWLYNSSCTPCPAGTYSKQGQSACTACPTYTYRLTEDACTSCSSGYYAANSSLSTCTSCSDSCVYAQYSEPCPTNASMFLCYDCDASNPENSYWINVSLLATSYSCLWACNDGYYQDLSSCLQCTYISCIPGKILTPCTSISDSNCDLDCINVTKPMFNSVWSIGCNWGCAEGYVMRTVNYLTWVQYECVLDGSPSFWNW